MADLSAHPDAVVLSFIDSINRGDVEALGDMLANDYVLTVFDEAPQAGRGPGAAGWRGYLTAFAQYIIHPRRFAVRQAEVAVLGHTTGSHLRLPDDEEARLTLIWIGRVDAGKIASWTLIEDTPQSRRAWGLD